MADFYNEKLKAFKHLERMLKQANQDQIKVSVDRIVFELTGMYAVSEAALKKRIKQFEAQDTTLRVEWNA